MEEKEIWVSDVPKQGSWRPLPQHTRCTLQKSSCTKTLGLENRSISFSMVRSSPSKRSFLLNTHLMGGKKKRGKKHRCEDVPSTHSFLCNTEDTPLVIGRRVRGDSQCLVVLVHIIPPLSQASQNVLLFLCCTGTQHTHKRASVHLTRASHHYHWWWGH